MVICFLQRQLYHYLNLIPDIDNFNVLFTPDNIGVVLPNTYDGTKIILPTSLEGFTKESSPPRLHSTSPPLYSLSVERFMVI